MWKLKIIALLLLISTVAISQEDDEFETLFGQEARFSGFGGPWMSFTTINNDFAHMMGGGGGVLINNSFYFGGYGYGLTNQISYEGDYIDFGYGGLMTGFIFQGNKALHPMVGLQVGWGDVSLRDSPTEDQVFVINPLVELEMNLTRFFKVGIGAGYRYTKGVDNFSNLQNSDFSGFSGRLSFYFGWF